MLAAHILHSCTHTLQIPARAVTPDFLAKRSVFISPQQSGAIYAALVKSKVISKAGDVLYDVRVVSCWPALVLVN
jgi:hypothetical protein